MQICGAELTSDDLTWLERHAGGHSRTALARELCARHRIRDATGRPRVTAVRIELARRSEELSLPATTTRIRAVRRESSVATASPESLTQEELAALGPLSVHRVEGRRDSAHAAWTRCLDEHHYLGSGPLCGAQIRYVVRAGVRVIGAASFSSAALHVAARDTYIGWSDGARKRNRDRVIMQSRFCLAVRVQNLASRVHSLLLSCVVDDWESRYGKRPVLAESFVDTTRFSGTSYRAANWTYVGETSGRGRQDREHDAAATIKSVWLFPLAQDWQETLRIEPVRKLDPDADWAEDEWGAAELGDARLTRRLVKYGRACFERPTANLPQACGSRAATKAAYRLLNHKTAGLDTFLASHRESSLARAAQESVVLAIQDTTSLNYSHHPATEGLGTIGSHNAATIGLQVHSVLLSNLAGTPLGLLQIDAWARAPKDFGGADKRYDLPIEKKESHKWIRGYEAADAAAKRLDRTQVVTVADREADIFELFETALEGKAQVLARAVQKRRILTPESEFEGYLWESVLEEPIVGEIFVRVPRSGSRKSRTAHIDVRYREVRISKPMDRKGKQRAVTVRAIAATERAETGGDDPVEWLLLTTLPVDSAESAIEKVRWYTQRWQIEVFHRTLKTGCKIERRQSSTAESLKAGLAIDAVVAWRVMHLVKLGREVPDAPCTVFFEELEWKALYCFIHKTKTPPAETPTLHDALRMVASLGGFLGRKSDGDPGAETTWKGLERLTDIAAVFAIFFSSA